MRKYKILNIVLLTLVFVWLPTVVRAATLYFDPAESSYGPGESFPVDLKINVESSCVNTIEAQILFPSGYLQAIDFIFGDSIINLWIDKPSRENIDDINKTGKLYLAGGTPGGYCGKIPGDPGESNTIARIIFKVPSLIVSDRNIEDVSITFGSSTRALLNDGFGTPDKLILGEAEINMLHTKSNATEDWREVINSDKIPPEPFVIELQSNSNIYNGQYYIDFFTTDKQSGVEYYEILEKRPDEAVGKRPIRSVFDYLFGYKKEPLNWKRGEIPYLLEDQSLKSVISVKAEDKAGNERVVEFVPPKSEQEKVARALNRFYTMLILMIAGGILFFLACIFAIMKIIKHRRTLTQLNNNLNRTNKNEKNEEEKNI